MENKEKNANKRKLTGTVVSNKMQDTVVVAVDRFVKHPKYGKFMKRRKKYKADSKGFLPEVGDKVTIEETKPISKDKHFRMVA